MATQPTNLPVPSESPRDLKFNAGKIDEFVTSLVNTYVDRFGNEHYTIEGLRWLAQQAIAQYGWILIDSFQVGADITLPNQALRDEATGEYYRWDGSLPKHVDAGSTPASSGGVGIGAWVGIGDAALRSILANSSNTAYGDALVAVKQPFTGSVARTVHDKMAETVTVADFGSVGTGNAVADMAAINAALNSGAKRINFGSLSYKITGWIIIPNPDMVLISDNASFEQTLWGYPVFEIRTPRVKMLGHWNFKYNGDRSVVISSNTLGYSYVTEGDWKAYGSPIWMNYYNNNDVSDFFIDTVRAYGFIGGVWFFGKRSRINRAEFDTLDFGVWGWCEDDQNIGDIFHKNITVSQGHSGHALYFTQAGKNLHVNSIVIDGSPNGCGAVKIHNAKFFYIGEISGSGMGAVAQFRDGAVGRVDSTKCQCTANVAYDGVNYQILAFGTDTDISVGTLDLYNDINGTNYNSVIQATVGNISIDNVKITNVNASPAQPRLYLSTAGGACSFGQIEINHPNSLCTNYFFDLISYSKCNITLPPIIKIAGPEVFLLKNTYAASNNYVLAYDPSLISPGVGANLVVCTQNTYFGVMFRGDGFAFNTITGSIPSVTHTANASITQTATTNLQRLRYATPGQTLTIMNTGGATNIVHNGAVGSDGNIITPTSSTILASNWHCAIFKKIGLNVYLIAYS